MSSLVERIADWTQTYCDSLTENYKQHSVRMCAGSDSDYSKRRLENIKKDVFMLSLIRILDKYSNQHHTMHQLSTLDMI